MTSIKIYAKYKGDIVTFHRVDNDRLVTNGDEYIFTYTVNMKLNKDGLSNDIPDEILEGLERLRKQNGW